MTRSNCIDYKKRSKSLPERNQFLAEQIQQLPSELRQHVEFSRFERFVADSFRRLEEEKSALEKQLQKKATELLQKNAALYSELNKQQQVEEALRESKERYELALKGANDGIWDLNMKTGELYVSDRFRKITQVPPGQAFNSAKHWLKIIHPDDRVKMRQVFDKHIVGTSEYIDTEHRVRLGKYQAWVRVRGLAIRNEKGEVQRVAGSISDITQQKDFEVLLEYQALHDSLTGLPNRALLQDRLNHSFEIAARNPGYKFALLFIDLDRFKAINDNLGHLRGDELLVRIAERLTSTIRNRDTVARLGGDEFCVLVEDLKELTDVLTIAKKILEQLSGVFEIDDQRIQTTASIGIALNSEQTTAADEMLRHADSAMYRAKAAGKNRYAIFDRVMHEKMIRVLEIEKVIARSIAEDQFTLHYQPILSLKTGKIISCECLLRMPLASHVPIQEVIEIAEESGQIIELGQLVFRKACEFSLILLEEGITDISVFVNISAQQFQYGQVGERLLKIIKQTGANPAQLGVEITESILLGNEDDSISTLENLREQGLHLSIDDFGTGYSSLAYLNRFSIHSLKIDRSFLKGIPQNRDNEKIADAIIRLGHSLALNIIAEGVETADQYSFLVAHGCDLAQGYHFSPPVEQDTFLQLCRQNRFGSLVKG